MPRRKKAGKGQQQFLSPEKYLRTKVRTLQKGLCYRSSSLFEVGEGYVIVTSRRARVEERLLTVLPFFTLN